MPLRKLQWLCTYMRLQLLFKLFHVRNSAVLPSVTVWGLRWYVHTYPLPTPHIVCLCTFQISTCNELVLSDGIPFFCWLKMTVSSLNLLLYSIILQTIRYLRISWWCNNVDYNKTVIRNCSVQLCVFYALFIFKQSMVEEFLSKVVNLPDENLHFLGMRLNFNHHYICIYIIDNSW